MATIEGGTTTPTGRVIIMAIHPKEIDWLHQYTKMTSDQRLWK